MHLFIEVVAVAAAVLFVSTVSALFMGRFIAVGQGRHRAEPVDVGLDIMREVRR